jgi:NADH-quinone oxidoreductase subunit K
LSGQVFGIFIIAIAAAESALALAIVFVLFRIRSSIEITEIDDLKG